MKIVYFTKYTRKGASSRLRSFQYQKYFEEKGYKVTYFPFFNDQYLKNLYEKRTVNPLQILSFYFRRFSHLFKVGAYDLVIIEKELFPYFPSVFERLLYFFKVKYIVDYDDAIFHNYDLNSSFFIRIFLGNKIKTVMRLSTLVVAGNKYLNDYAINARAEKTIIFPTVVDLKRYSIKTLGAVKDVLVIGWIGSPTTFKYFKNLTNVIREMQFQYDIHWHIIGAQWPDIPNDLKNITFKDWYEETEYDCLRQFDIGIMPLQETPWENGKCAYKLIQYMAAGLPVVASAVGMNSEIVFNGFNGYTVLTDHEWITRLKELIEDKQLRENMGRNGRLLIEKDFNAEKNFTNLFQLIAAYSNG